MPVRGLCSRSSLEFKTNFRGGKSTNVTHMIRMLPLIESHLVKVQVEHHWSESLEYSKHPKLFKSWHDATSGKRHFLSSAWVTPKTQAHYTNLDLWIELFFKLYAFSFGLCVQGFCENKWIPCWNLDLISHSSYVNIQKSEKVHTPKHSWSQKFLIREIHWSLYWYLFWRRRLARFNNT